MIQSRELRIGNLLLFNREICTVTGISGNKAEIRTLRGNEVQSVAFSALQPISLNEEWMEKLSGDENGYLTLSDLERKTDSSDMILLSTMEGYLHDDGFLRVCAYEYEKQEDGTIQGSDDVITLGYTHIRYVHQVQNLYFDLSGKELVIAKL
jgi:hypothetical protein